MSSRIRVEPVMFHPAGIMIYKATFRGRVICLLRRDGDEWHAYGGEGATNGKTNIAAAEAYRRKYLGDN